MQKMTEKNTKLHEMDWENVKPVEFERVLNLYGMKKNAYCGLFGKSKGWWYNVLRKRKFLTYTEVKILADSVGIETFNTLLSKVRSQNKQEQPK